MSDGNATPDRVVTRVYVAGPMRGYEDDNRAEFGHVSALLRAAGYIVASPAEVLVHEMTTRGFMRADLPVMLACDGVATLDGWEASTGARIETYVAHECGLWVRPYRELLEAPYRELLEACDE